MKHTFDGILGLEKLIDRYPQEAYQIVLTAIGECEIFPRPAKTTEEMADIAAFDEWRAPFEKWFVTQYSPRALGNRDCALSWKAWQAALEFAASPPAVSVGEQEKER